jgi:hypothetical protein
VPCEVSYKIGPGISLLSCFKIKTNASIFENNENMLKYIRVLRKLLTLSLLTVMVIILPGNRVPSLRRVLSLYMRLRMCKRACASYKFVTKILMSPMDLLYQLSA